MKSKLRSLFRRVMRRVPPSKVKAAVLLLIRSYTKSVAPEASLRFLLDLDATLYEMQGNLSVAYGKGLHSKHRHTGYHDFFARRLSPGERVLDLGCGIGALAFSMAEKAQAVVYGIDLNADSIAQAHQKYAHPNVTYIVGDVLKDLPAGRYDVIVLSNVLEHLPDRAAFLRRVVERTHPARLLIRVPVFERDWRVPLKKELGVEWRLDPTHETEYTLESFGEEMRDAGLAVTHLEVRWGEIWSELKPDA